ncbi:hypothetical protein A4A49_53576 [Nicotiana attenuata]|uniref:Uncharacterized protein n=1 Tax=Nicotiana attenuata TaxID=49451 RepID=A0A1J6IPR6_NICAT|nr:hypothetical protein A4A49_53576 [Nicotiana attenuata]
MSVEEHHQSVSLKSLIGAQTQVNLGEESSGNQSISQQFERDIQQASSGDGKKETTTENQVTDQLGLSSNKNKQVVGSEIEDQGKHETKATEVGDPNRSRVNLFASNRAAENGMMLTYMAPDIVNGKVVVKLDKGEVEKEIIKWKNALIV